MKKRAPIILLIAAIVLLAGSLWKNHADASEKERLKNNLLSDAVSALRSISMQTEELLAGIEKADMSYEECENRLILLSNSFTKLHVSLKTQATFFPPPGVTRNCYPGAVGFDMLSSTLTGGWGEWNVSRFQGVLFDNAVSEQEIEYLLALKNSADNMLERMTTGDGQYRLADISPSSLDQIILEFTDPYDIANGDSPLKLLFV